MGNTTWEHVRLVDNKKAAKKRFELQIDGSVAFIEYMISKKDIMYLTHTEVPSALEGQGVGSTLVRKVLDHIRTTNYKMAPLCPFVAAYLKRHPELAEDLLAPGYSVG